MMEATVNGIGNLIRVTYRGKVAAEETLRWIPKIQTLVTQVPPGFRMLSDLSGLDEMDLACVPHIEQVMDFCNARGISMVVRVIPDPHKDIGLNILSLFHYRRGVKIVTCETLEEALAVLAQ